jgi:adenine phosphoribosyltransferase
MISFKLSSIIRDIPDFPKPGILFKDITPLYADPGILKECITEMINQFKGVKFDAVAGIEARGFLTGILLAQALQIPFIPIRKAGKLPADKISTSYELEYGTATIEMHRDNISPGMQVLIHDDVLATGGSALAAARLIKEAGGYIAGFSFLVNLASLGGTPKLEQFGKPVHSLISF